MRLTQQEQRQCGYGRATQAFSMTDEKLCFFFLAIAVIF